jgi:hypothetical protein
MQCGKKPAYGAGASPIAPAPPNEALNGKKSADITATGRYRKGLACDPSQRRDCAQANDRALPPGVRAGMGGIR